MNLACSLRATGRFDECLSFLRDTMPTAKRVLGADNEVYLNFVWTFSDCINRDRNLSRDDLLDAVATIDDSFPGRPCCAGVKGLFSQQARHPDGSER